MSSPLVPAEPGFPGPAPSRPGPRTPGRHRILIVNDDRIGPRMAGPPIRAYHIAEQLAAEHDVRLVSTRGCDLRSWRFDCRYVPYERLRPEVDWADVVVFQGFVMHKAPWLAETDKVLVVDLYDPMHLEQLAMNGTLDQRTRRAHVGTSVRVLNEQMRRGDFFLCASDRQRHFWLGALAAVGRVNTFTYDEDETLRSLLAVCPFGLPVTPPARTRPTIRGVVPGIGADDRVILWAGGIYNWFDPVTLVRAVDRVRADHADLRLYFLGMRHPDPDMPEMRTAVRTRQVADELGLTGKHVFFNEGWVDYDDRQNYLLEADIGVSTHVDHVETTFSFRTRMLDYLWAGLPMVSTRGDSFAELIDEAGLGLTVPQEDVGALADALSRLLDDPELAARCRANVAAVRDTFSWHNALAPLLDFCRRPRRAPDVAALPRPGFDPLPTRPAKGNLALAAEYFRAGGVGEVARRAYGRLRRLTGRGAGGTR